MAQASGSTPYAAFLPPERHAAASREPEGSWWPWQGCDVHLARARDADAAVRLLVVHGAGGHSGAVWPLAALLADAGFDVAAVDLPLYGRTVVPDRAAVRYDDWVRLLVDLVEAEDDGRPLVLLGASIGGMLAREVGLRSHGVAAVAATCLVDPRSPRVLARITRFGVLGAAGGALAALVRGPLARARIPIGRVAPLSRMSRDRGLSDLCAADPAGGGSRVTLGFLASWMRYRHGDGPRRQVPLLLVHPGRDTWTPVALSLPVVARHPGPATVTILRECGHFPVEEPGLTDLLDALSGLGARVAATAGR